MALAEFIDRIHEMKAVANRFRQIEVPLSKMNYLQIQSYFRVPVNKFVTIQDIADAMGFAESTVMRYSNIWEKYKMIEIKRILNGKIWKRLIRRRFKFFIVMDHKTIQFLE